MPATWPPCSATRRAHVEEIGEDEAGFPLGVDAETVYRQSCRPLAPGESLTMYTDGISEAMNDAGELYGIQRLRSNLARRAQRVGRGPRCSTTCGGSSAAVNKTTTCAWSGSAGQGRNKAATAVRGSQSVRATTRPHETMYLDARFCVFNSAAGVAFLCAASHKG